MTKKHILNLEVPRALTTTIKAFDFRTAAALQANGIDYDSVDLNMMFWSFALKFADTPIRLEKFIAGDLQPTDIETLLSAQRAIEAKYGLELRANGYFLQTQLVRSADVGAAIDTAQLPAFIEDFVTHVLDILLLDHRSFDVIAINCSSISSLVMACALKHALSRQLAFQPRFVLVGSGYENFSLRFRQPDLQNNGHLLKYFDAVIYDEESLAAALAKQCGIENAVGATPTRETMAAMLADSLYLKALPVPPAGSPVLLRLSRNPCYWRRCNFCVQNNKHQAGMPFLESVEIDVALAEIDIFYAHGFRFFIFSDEAVSPASIKRLVEHIRVTGMDIHWTPRMTANDDVDEILVRNMRATGCFEVLLGLETITEQTASAMGKMPLPNRQDTIERHLAIYAENNIGIYLNLIYRFPTESDDVFRKETYAFYERMAARYPAITWQLNPFTLFYGSNVFKNPDRYRLRWLEEPTPQDDLKMDFDFEDQFGRRPADSHVEEYYAATIGIPINMYHNILTQYGRQFLAAILQVSYASFGVIHKALHGGNIVLAVFPQEDIA